MFPFNYPVYYVEAPYSLQSVDAEAKRRAEAREAAQEAAYLEYLTEQQTLAEQQAKAAREALDSAKRAAKERATERERQRQREARRQQQYQERLAAEQKQARERAEAQRREAEKHEAEQAKAAAEARAAAVARAQQKPAAIEAKGEQKIEANNATKAWTPRTRNNAFRQSPLQFAIGPEGIVCPEPESMLKYLMEQVMGLQIDADESGVQQQQQQQQQQQTQAQQSTQEEAQQPQEETAPATEENAEQEPWSMIGDSSTKADGSCSTECAAQCQADKSADCAEKCAEKCASDNSKECVKECAEERECAQECAQEPTQVPPQDAAAKKQSDKIDRLTAKLTKYDAETERIAGIYGRLCHAEPEGVRSARSLLKVVEASLHRIERVYERLDEISVPRELRRQKGSITQRALALADSLEEERKKQHTRLEQLLAARTSESTESDSDSSSTKSPKYKVTLEDLQDDSDF